ncbi:unnamed protein product, partial [Allacma fusca]
MALISNKTRFYLGFYRLRLAPGCLDQDSQLRTRSNNQPIGRQCLKSSGKSESITVLKPPKSRYPLPIQKYKQERCNNSVRSETVSKQEILGRLSRNPRVLCNCTGFHQKTIDKNSFVESKCSDEATLAGANQHVLTFSFYSKPESVRATNKSYFDGILPNLKGMKKIYPGWIMRVYTNASYTPEFCDVVCADEKLFFCDIRGLQRFAPQVESVDPRLWRGMPMGDPTVKIFASRDLDSRLSQREKDA